MTWIPIMERTPEKSGLYLVTIYLYGRLITTCDTWIEERREWCFNMHPVMAWMELPEPYNEKEEKR